MADLWFHSMVAMAHLGLRPEEVVAELGRREGLSGLVEFAMRGNKPTAVREPSED
jgi:phosphoribosyl-ATP pyrophosphohydrolase